MQSKLLIAGNMREEIVEKLKISLSEVVILKDYSASSATSDFVLSDLESTSKEDKLLYDKPKSKSKYMRNK